MLPGSRVDDTQPGMVGFISEGAAGWAGATWAKTNYVLKDDEMMRNSLKIYQPTENPVFSLPPTAHKAWWY